MIAQQVRFHERLPANRAGVRPNSDVNPFRVLAQVGFQEERFITGIALKGLLGSMSGLVIVQCDCRLKVFAADLAAVRPVVRMDNPMTLQGGHVLEAGATQFTHQRPVAARHLVRPTRVRRLQEFATLRTGECKARMLVHVILKWGFTGIGGVTSFTGEHLDGRDIMFIVIVLITDCAVIRTLTTLIDRICTQAVITVSVLCPRICLSNGLVSLKISSQNWH